MLDIVAEIDGRIVGNIVYAKAKILGDDGNSYNVICFGLISVLLEFQGRGIGGMLIEHTKNLAKQLGYHAILIYGDPEYYSRYGFVAAETYGIGTPDNMYAFYTGSSYRNGKEFYSANPLDEIDEYEDLTIEEAKIYKGQQFVYLFDFGDMWEFKISVMDFRHNQKNNKSIC